MLNKEQLESKYQFPFGDPAINVLKTAEGEARKFQHNYIGTEHLLAAWISVGNLGVAQSLGLELNKVRSAIQFIVGPGDRTVEGEIGFTPRVIKALELSVDEAKRLHDGLLEPDHIMLGVVRKGEGIAAGVIESLGVTLEKVRFTILRDRSNAPRQEAPTYLDILARYRAFFEDPNQDPQKKQYLEWILRGAYNLTLPTKKQDQ